MKTEEQLHREGQRRGWRASIATLLISPPLWEGLLLLIVGATALASGHPWLFASLGPTAYEQVEKPHQKSSRMYNVIVGHFVGIGGGFVGLALIGAWNAPKTLSTGVVSPDRLWATVIAAALTTLINLLLKSGQPAALATAMLVTLGAFQTAESALWLAVGIVILAVVGEPVRRLRHSRMAVHGIT